MKKTFILLLVALSLWSVSVNFAMASFDWSNGLVQCGRTGSAQQQATGCDFTALINLVNTLIQYLIFIAMPLAAIAFAYAGWIYLSAGGDTGKVKKAHQLFMSVGIGFALILSAWLIFKYIAVTFLSPYYSGSTFLK